MKIFPRIAAAFAVAAALAQPFRAGAQDMGALPEIGQVLAGNGPALSVKVKDLTSDWRTFMLIASAQSSEAAHNPFFIDDASAYYTRGQSITVGRDIFLAAYHVRTTSEDAPNPFASMFMPPSVSRETTLYLSLINLSRCGGLANIRPFDPKSVPEHPELAEGSGQPQQTGDTNIIEVTREAVNVGQAVTQPSYTNVTDDAHLKRIGAAVQKYARAHGGRLPGLASSRSALRALRPYGVGRAIFRQADADLLYAPNASLSHRRLQGIKSPGKVIVLYGRKPDPCGCHHALFADGSAHEVLPGDWVKTKRFSGIQD